MRLLTLARMVAFAALGSLTISRAAAQAPVISSVSPSAVKPGETTELTILGTGLDGATAGWMSLEGQIELAPLPKNGESKSSVKYRVTLPADAPAGVGGFRIATERGVSNLRLLLVDDLQTITKNGKNKTADTAQELTAPIAVEGACDAEGFDYYQLKVSSGQRLSFEVFASRLGSALDPVIRLLDSQGKELAFSDDEPGLGADGRFSHEFSTAGNYLVEIRDIRYAGNANYRYRLRVGDFPLVNTAYPLAVQAGSSTPLEFAGVDTEGVDPLKVAPAAQELGLRSLGVKRTGGNGGPAGGDRSAGDDGPSGIVSYLVSNLPEPLEVEPNDEQAKATLVSLPAGINGRLHEPGDRDYFRFVAKQGDKLVFAGQARQFDSPADLFLRIFQADGKRLAEVDDSGMDEGRLEFTAPADGEFTLMVEDLVHRGGPEFAYRVEARPAAAGFELSLDADKFDVPLGGLLVSKVTVARSGYEGPIELTVEGAPEGSKLEGTTIAEKAKETTLKITLPESSQPGALYLLKIKGVGKLKDQELVATANSLAAWRKASPALAYPNPEFVETVAVGVGPVFPKFFELSVAKKEVEVAADAKEAKLKVTLKRLEKFDDTVTVSLAGLPQGFAAKPAPIAKGKTDAELTLTLPKERSPGVHKLTLTGQGTYLNQPQTIVLADVVLKIAGSPAKDNAKKEDTKK